MSALLELDSVGAAYGQARALFGVDLEVRAGGVVALLGRNGMGKTTTIRTICRLMAHDQGEIHFDGRTIAGLAAHRVARLGIGLVPEGRRCFAPLTVRDNLRVAEREGFQSGRWTWETVTALFPVLAERRDQAARTLSGGEQQMLAIARALTTNPRLLVLDEATEGLAPVVRASIWSALAQLKAEGQSILLVDKNLAELLLVADRCVILERGRTVWTGTPSALTEDVRDRHLGV